MITVKLLPRKDFVKKDGSSPICLILTIEGQKKRITLDHSIPEEVWDYKYSQVKSSYPEADSLNLLLKSYKKRADDILYEYDLHNKVLTFDSFVKDFKRPKSDCFYSFIDNELASYSDRSVNAISTITCYKTDLSKLKLFRASLTFREIRRSFNLGMERCSGPRRSNGERSPSNT